MPTFLNNRYLLHETLGQGAMGVVYRATDRLSGDTVAVKCVTISGENLQFASRSDAETVEEINLALAQEFQTLASLRHPNIISVLDYGFDDLHQPFFTMRYLPEATTIMEASQGLDETGKVYLLIQMLQALTYLHRRNILHRDLKPGNVLVTAQNVRVLDFGLSVSREHASGRSGTLAYMSPETLQMGIATEASDLYAIGVMAYQMFAGELPFNAVDIMGILTRPPDMEKVLASPRLVDVINRLLQKSPEDRYATAYDVLVALNESVVQPLPQEDTAIRESFLQAAQFVGRETELNQLLTGLDEAAEGRGNLWLVGGESGVGKTRLLKELRIRALVQGANVLRGQAVEDQGWPHQIWQGPLRRLALMGQMSDLEAGVLKPILPDMETLAGREIPEAPDVDEKEAARRLSLTIGEVIKKGALATPPLVLLLEDMHWALESLDTLTALSRTISEIPILVIDTYRAEDIPDLPERLPTSKQMHLKRFDPQAIAELSVSMLGDSGSNPRVLSLLQEETEGNVFFLVETVRALAEEAGSLQSISSQTLPQAVFAGGVQRIIERRLQQVPEHYQPLLKFAAVIGRALELEIFQTAYPEINLESWLTTCANVAVLEIQEEQWRFAHDKFRETLLTELETEERRDLHNQAAHAIEEAFSHNLAPYYGRLAWHHSQAGNQAQERTFAGLAGKQAAAQFSHDEALRYFDQALKLTPETDAAARYELLTQKREIHRLLSNAEKELETIEIQQQIAMDLGEPAKEAEVALTWGNHYYDHGDYAAALEFGHQALEVAAAAHEFDTQLKTYNLLASALWKQNEFDEATMYAQSGLDLAQEAGDQHNEAMRLRNTLGMIFVGKRELNTARGYFEQSLTIALENENTRQQGMSLNSLGIVAGYQGDFQGAKNYYEQAQKIAHETGARKDEALALVNLGWIAGILGEYEQAMNSTKASITIAREIGEPYHETYCLINLSSYASATGDHTLALKSAEQAQVLAQQIGDRSAEAWALTNLGHSCLASQDFDQAARAYQEALEIRQEFKQPLLATEPAAGLARALFEQGNLEVAYQHIQEILPILEQDKSLEGTDDPLRVYLACFLVLQAKNDPRTPQILQDAHDLILARAANIPEAQTRESFLESIPHHQEILRAWQIYNSSGKPA